MIKSNLPAVSGSALLDKTMVQITQNGIPGHFPLLLYISHFLVDLVHPYIAINTPGGHNGHRTDGRTLLLTHRFVVSNYY